MNSNTLQFQHPPFPIRKIAKDSLHWIVYPIIIFVATPFIDRGTTDSLSGLFLKALIVVLAVYVIAFIAHCIRHLYMRWDNRIDHDIYLRKNESFEQCLASHPNVSPDYAMHFLDTFENLYRDTDPIKYGNGLLYYCQGYKVASGADNENMVPFIFDYSETVSNLATESRSYAMLKKYLQDVNTNAHI